MTIHSTTKSHTFYYQFCLKPDLLSLLKTINLIHTEETEQLFHYSSHKFLQNLSIASNICLNFAVFVKIFHLTSK